MTVRLISASEQLRPIGLIYTLMQCSDLWAVGLIICRNIEQFPLIFHCHIVFLLIKYSDASLFVELFYIIMVHLAIQQGNMAIILKTVCILNSSKF